jgi:hypothetical protein
MTGLSLGSEWPCTGSTEQARTGPATLSDGLVPETRFISLQINKEKHRHNKVCMETK